MATHFQSLFTLLGRYRWRYVIGVTAVIATNLFQQVMPWAIGGLVSDLQHERLPAEGIWRTVGLILAAALLLAVARFAWRYYVIGTSRHVEVDIRAALFEQLERLSPSFFHRNKTGDLMAMATNDLTAIRAIAGEGVLMTIDAVFMTLITFAAMVYTIGWQLSLIAVLPLPILALSAAFFGKFMYLRSRAVQDAFGKLSDVTQENISGMRVVKAFGQEPAEERKFDAANRSYLARFMSMMRIQGAIEPTIQLLAGLCFVLALIYPGQAVMRGELELGAFVALTMYINMLIWPMIAMGWVVSIVQRGFAAFARIQGVLFEQPAVQTAPDAQMPQSGRIEGQIEIRNLTFQYAGANAPALADISLQLSPGETLGIIGRTGSGKSTLVSLLARLFNPPRGTIFVDGVDLLDLPVTALRESIALVPQESFLFSRIVAENIGFAPGNWSREQIQQAARTAQVEQDILEFLPEGYETMVGERGVTLSGGQRQRVSLSRAVLKQAPILILDDSLSAVDTSTEARILGGLRPVMKGRTTILISHRVAAVKASDWIIVLDAGRIVEQGTHDQLIDLGGRYYRTHKRQQLEEAIANVD